MNKFTDRDVTEINKQLIKKLLIVIPILLIVLFIIPANSVSSETVLTGITLDDSHILMLDNQNVRSHHRLTVTGYPGKVTPELMWSSCRPAVADVDETGLVRAYSAGEAVITATTEDGKHTASCRVRVLPVTRERIKSRWERYKPVLDVYRSKDDIFLEEPRLEAPYKAGKLQPVFKQDGLNMANYVRFLAGVQDDLVIDEQESIYSQHGAVLIAVSEFSHWPPKPDDMDDEFFRLGRIGSAGILGAGYSSIDRSIKNGYMPDRGLDNLRHVGHRTSLLEPKMQKIGVGYSLGGLHGGYTAIGVSDRSREEWVDYDYVAWPNRGWFPGDMFPVHSWGIAWSVSFSSRYYLREMDEVEVKLTQLSDGREWVFNESHNEVSHFDRYFHITTTYGPTIIFRPEDIKEYKGSYRVEVTGLGKIAEGPVDKVEYTVNFYDPDRIIWTPVSSVKLNKSSMAMGKGETQTLAATVSPPYASEKSVIWSSDNTLVATVDRSGVVTALGPGEASISATALDGKLVDRCRISVPYVPLQSLALTDDITLSLEGVRSRERVAVQAMPSDASYCDVTWSSDSDSVVVVSDNGVLTAVGEGEAKVTVRSAHYEDIASVINVNVTNDGVFYGDTNGNGTIEVVDAIMVLRHIVGLISLDEDAEKAADVTGNEKVTVEDAIRILRYIVGLY